MLDSDDRVLLVGQHRYTLDTYSWEIPEGGVPDGETAYQVRPKVMTPSPVTSPGADS